MKKILLVSSSNAFLERNYNLLKRTDCHIFTATSGKEAIALHLKEQVNLVVADLYLDDMGGDQFCKLIQNDESLRKVIFIMACRDNPEELKRADECGAHLLITKPIQPMQLLTMVEQFISVQLVRSKRVHLRVNVMTKKDNISFSCISNDISATGILLESEEYLDWGDRIVCRFSLPDPSVEIEVDGEVVRSIRKLDGEHQYGVHFVDICMDASMAIIDYVARISRE